MAAPRMPLRRNGLGLALSAEIGGQSQFELVRGFFRFSFGLDDWGIWQFEFIRTQEKTLAVGEIEIH